MCHMGWCVRGFLIMQRLIIESKGAEAISKATRRVLLGAVNRFNKKLKNTDRPDQGNRPERKLKGQIQERTD